MRLAPSQVRLICQKILLTLRSQQLINLKTGEADVLQSMEEIFLKDLKVEDEINAEAEKLLAQYARQMGSNIDRQQMFQMIKKQLIKDKKAVV